MVSPFHFTLKDLTSKLHRFGPVDSHGAAKAKGAVQ